MHKNIKIDGSKNNEIIKRWRRQKETLEVSM